jgi:hypothetical protein
MSGHERYLLYRFVTETGLRADEIRKLRKVDFDFNAGTVTVKAETAKGKRQDTQHLSPGLSAELRDFLAAKLPDSKAFGGRYAALDDKTSDMLRSDLARAEIPYKDEAGRVFDFHALRGQCATLLAASGASMKTAQTILRHRDINLTANVYTHVLRGQEAQAVASIADLSYTALEAQVAVKSGTDDRVVGNESLSKACFSDGRSRTAANGSAEIPVNGEPQTAFFAQENRSLQSSEPAVGGSSPSGRIITSQTPHCSCEDSHPIESANSSWGRPTGPRS